MCQFYDANVSINQKMVKPNQSSSEATWDAVRSRNDLLFAGCRDSTSILIDPPPWFQTSLLQGQTLDKTVASLDFIAIDICAESV